MIRPESVLKTSLRDVLKMSWRRLEDVLKTFWRPMTKANMFVLIKTSWWRLLKMKTKDAFKTSSRRLYQDECLLESFSFIYFAITSSHYKHLESHLFLSSIVFIVSTLIIGIFHCLNYTLILLPLIITHLVIDFVITM